MPTDKERIASLEGQVEELRNYIRDYLKGKEMKECITHHHACDCREELHKNEIAELQSTIDELRAEKEELYEALGELSAWQVMGKGGLWETEGYLNAQQIANDVLSKYFEELNA